LAKILFGLSTLKKLSDELLGSFNTGSALLHKVISLFFGTGDNIEFRFERDKPRE
jgi:hypothetical protein